MPNSKQLHSIEEGTFSSANIAFPSHIYFKNYLPPEGLSKKFYHVIFQHGMIEYHKRHEELFDHLRKAFGKNILISAMDLYGHGKSGGDRGYIDTFDSFTQDFAAFVRICFDRYYLEPDIEVVPIFISHSLGGLITLKTLADETIELPIQPKACIFVNPCMKPKIELPKEVSQFLENLPETLLKVRIPLIYDAYDLSQDQEKAKEFIGDHLISKSITIKLGVETIKACKDINSVSYFFNIPSLFMISGDDRVVEASKTELFYTGMDKKLAKKINYPTMRHDLLNETCRNEVFLEIINFIKAIK